MSIAKDSLQDICDSAIEQVADLYPSLSMMFIFHESGQFHDVVAMKEHELSRHPAGRTAQTILEKNNNREQTSFLGLAIDTQSAWWGLKTTEAILALFNINMDEFDREDDVRRAVYHNIWHALNLLSVRQKPEYMARFRSGPMIPKRSPMNASHLNLEADVFAGTMSALLGDGDSINALASRRARESIMPIHIRRAEDYPFVISLDAAQYAYQEVVKAAPSPQDFLLCARQVALDISEEFDDDSIRHWWAFAEPAQDMAWRNFSPELILGSAAYTSDDPFVRATAHQICGVIGVEPLQSSRLAGSYNSFAGQANNQLLHRELIEKAFEEAVARGVREESGRPLSLVANEQNENLADGAILGWCAGALQAAARAFDSALSAGASPQHAARLEFDGNKDETGWDVLKKISGKIVEQKRRGFGVTLGNVVELCSSNPAFTPILGSLMATAKDPAYAQKIELANGLSVRNMPKLGPAMAGPAAAPRPAGPVMAAPAPSGPSLGGGSSNRLAILRQRGNREKSQTDRESEDGRRE